VKGVLYADLKLEESKVEERFAVYLLLRFGAVKLGNFLSEQEVQDLAALGQKLLKKSDDFSTIGGSAKQFEFKSAGSGWDALGIDTEKLKAVIDGLPQRLFSILALLFPSVEKTGFFANGSRIILLRYIFILNLLKCSCLEVAGLVYPKVHTAADTKYQWWHWDTVGPLSLNAFFTLVPSAPFTISNLLLVIILVDRFTHNPCNDCRLRCNFERRKI
jgi:hypothetical protein